jgi:hypothetical protein
MAHIIAEENRKRELFGVEKRIVHNIVILCLIKEEKSQKHEILRIHDKKLINFYNFLRK